MPNETDRVLEALGKRLIPDKSERAVFLTREIDDDSAESVCRDLYRLRNSRRAIPFYINSPGGSCADGWAIFDAILASNRKGSPVIGIVQGTANSMASVVLQACKRRLITPNSTLHLHELNFTTDHTPFTGAMGEVAHVLTQEQRIVEAYCKRSRWNADDLRSKLRGNEWYMSADEAVAEGFADAVALR